MKIDPRTAAVLADFDWMRWNDLPYLDQFFDKWGLEPFPQPQEEEIHRFPVATKENHVPLPANKMVVQWATTPIKYPALACKIKV